MPRSLSGRLQSINRAGSTFGTGLSARCRRKTSLSGVMHWKSLFVSGGGGNSPESAANAHRNELSPAGSVGRKSRLQQMREVEAVLFLSREPISARKLKQLADLSDLNQTRTLVHLLNHYYDSTGRAFRVESVAGGFLLMTRPELSSWLRRLVPGKQQIRLSAPTMETLVVVAYRQPVLRAEIDAVRGVNCGEILRQLMEMDMVRISGRSEELGRPYLYSTTNRFLRHFGLDNLDELPKSKTMLMMPVDESPDPDSSQDSVASETTSSQSSLQRDGGTDDHAPA